MSFLEELKKELHDVSQKETPGQAVWQQDRLQRFVEEELSLIRQEIREGVRSGRYPSAEKGRVFEGIRLFHEGEHRHQTESLAAFYSFLAQENILNKEVLSQRKRPLFGFHYEIRYSLSDRGQQYYQLFAEAMQKEGVSVSSLFVRPDQEELPLPYTAQGNVKYDFELEHYLNDYPKLYYRYRIQF